MKRKRGGYYGFDGKVGPGAPLWTKGTEVEAPSYAKGAKRGRKLRKGGTRFSNASYSFKGTGTRGMPDYVGNGNTAGAGTGGTFNIVGGSR